VNSGPNWRLDLSNEPSLIQIEPQELELCFFPGKGSGQGQIPGLLTYGPLIPDRTIVHSILTDF
jgi:hypothetical protein